MIDEIKQEAEKRMKKCLESLQHELARVRTGRAHPSLLDHVTVDYYGKETLLSQVASVNATDARTLLVTPWEKNMVSVIEKAIMMANLGLNPVTSGQAIRVPMPALTEQRRKELVKVVKSEAENARVAIRNVRREANQQAQTQLKQKVISEDQEKQSQVIIQKLTDKYIDDVEKMLALKEADLMEV